MFHVYVYVPVLSTLQYLVSEGEGMKELGKVGEVGVLESVSDCAHDSRVIPLALAVHSVSMHVHQLTCTCKQTKFWCSTLCNLN